MMELLSITFFSGMMGIFIILLLLMGALLLIGKNPFKGFSLTALVTTKPLAAKLQPYGGASGWEYRPFAQKGKTMIGRKGIDKKTGQVVGQGAQTISLAKRGVSYLVHRRINIQRSKKIGAFFGSAIDTIKVIRKITPTQGITLLRENAVKKILKEDEYKTYTSLLPFGYSLSEKEYSKIEEFVRYNLLEFSTLRAQSEWRGLKKYEKKELDEMKKKNKKFIEDFGVANLARYYGAKAQRENKSFEYFGKIVAFSNVLKVDLTKDFLIGVYAEGMRQALAQGKDRKTAEEEAEKIVKNIVSGYNKFVRDMRGGGAPRVLDEIKRSTGVRTVFDLPYAPIDIKKFTENKEIKKSIENTLNKIQSDEVGLIVNPARLEELMTTISYYTLTITMERNERIATSVQEHTSLRKPKEAVENWLKKTPWFSEQPVELSYLVMLSGLPQQTRPETTK